MATYRTKHSEYQIGRVEGRDIIWPQKGKNANQAYVIVGYLPSSDKRFVVDSRGGSLNILFRGRSIPRENLQRRLRQNPEIGSQVVALLPNEEGELYPTKYYDDSMFVTSPIEEIIK